MNIDCTTVKHNLAWIQIPPSCKFNKKYFHTEVLKFWSKALHIYIASAYKKNENVHEKSSCIVSVFAPKEYKLERYFETTYQVDNEVTAEIVAIRRALIWILDLYTDDKTKTVIFSNSEPALERIRLILENETLDELDNEIKGYLQRLKDLGKFIGFAWVPQDVSAHRCVSEYANYWFHSSDHQQEKELPILSPPNESYYLNSGPNIYFHKDVSDSFYERFLVLTTAIQTDQQNDSNSIGIITSLYVPNPRRCTLGYKLDTPCIWARKVHQIPVNSFISAQLEAFHFAVQHVSIMNIPPKKTVYIVFISDTRISGFKETLKQNLFRRKDLKRDLAALQIRGITVGLTWIERNYSRLPELKLLQNYAEEWAHSDRIKLEYFGHFDTLQQTLNNQLTSNNSLFSVYVTSSKFWIINGKEISTPQYFYNKILTLWANTLCVFTKVVHEGKTGRYFTYVYIPELNTVKKKTNWVTVRNKRIAHLAAIQFAVRIIKNMEPKNQKIAIITDCPSALQLVIHALRHRDQEKYRRLLINDIEHIRDNLRIVSYPLLWKTSLWESIVENFENSDWKDCNCTAALQEIDPENKIVWVKVSSNIPPEDYENEQIPLSNSLQVFISFVQQMNAEDERDKHTFVLSVYFPQLNTWERKFVKSSDGFRSALDFAFERINLLQFKEESIVVFTSYNASLQEDIHRISHNDFPIRYTHLVEEINSLETKGKKIGFVLIPENSNISQFQSCKEFAEAWEYDDHDSGYGFFSEKCSPKDESFVYSWSPACSNYLGKATVNKCQHAWVQLPPKLSILNREDYFNKEVLIYWSDYVHVYTNAVLVHENNGNFRISIYIPEFNVLERKSIYVSTSDDVEAQLSALTLALKRTRDLSSIKTKFVFFTKCAKTLNSVLYIMNHENLSECGKLLKDNVMYLSKKHSSVVFAWVPPDLSISQYKTVAEYAVAQTEEEENENTDIPNEDEDSYYDFFDYDIDLQQFERKQRFKSVLSNVI